MTSRMRQRNSEGFRDGATTRPSSEHVKGLRIMDKLINKDIVLRAILIANSLEEAYEMVERMEGEDGE